ncbi:SGNH/GDSL hydrolase family protein [Paenibacillus sp. FJAT-26967]|uniref:SGNH/GDSL hydrolase family protein n=1 Tax=Paenibacillus sp. FJAT-26967 TaxID=1729690 RepID=UPI0008383273|nr:SGNH/GDSL hydrolase family protein [Paenibacillus sp. FJAT-26967]
MRFEKRDKLVMIGDSITDCGRARPYGEGRVEARGSGYVMQTDSLLQSAYPSLGIRVINMGISGNTVRDLQERWKSDVLDLKPDWLSILIGINDVWRQYDAPLMTEKHVYLEEYAEVLEKLVFETRSQLKGLVLMTPFYLEPNEQDPMRATMDAYGAVVRRIAEKYDTVFVDTQAAMDQLLKHNYAAALAWDRVHPNQSGHMAIARAFLNAVGFDWRGEEA